MSEDTSAGAKSYRQAGVDIDGAMQALAGVEEVVRATWSDRVVPLEAGFAGLFELPHFKEGVLVSSIDGVGTKVMLAATTGRWEGIGCDIVAHCVNDIAVHGARGLVFLDYLGAGKLDREAFSALLASMADACRREGLALIGGETAEMPGVYAPDQLDVVGCIIGVAERSALRTGAGIRPGDRLLGLASDGLHTNGYTLVRAVIEQVGAPLERYEPRLGMTLADALLRPHRSYAKALLGCFERFGDRVLGAAHVTGGGIPGNLVRLLPQGCRARVCRSWPLPPLFEWIMETGSLAGAEMARTFNLGIGLIVCVREDEAASVERWFEAHGERAFPIGEIIAGERGVEFDHRLGEKR